MFILYPNYCIFYHLVNESFYQIVRSVTSHSIRIAARKASATMDQPQLVTSRRKLKRGSQKGTSERHWRLALGQIIAYLRFTILSYCVYCACWIVDLPVLDLSLIVRLWLLRLAGGVEFALSQRRRIRRIVLRVNTLMVRFALWLNWLAVCYQKCDHYRCAPNLVEALHMVPTRPVSTDRHTLSNTTNPHIHHLSVRRNQHIETNTHVYLPFVQLSTHSDTTRTHPPFPGPRKCAKVASANSRKRWWGGGLTLYVNFLPQKFSSFYVANLWLVDG